MNDLMISLPKTAGAVEKAFLNLGNDDNEKFYKYI